VERVYQQQLPGFIPRLSVIDSLSVLGTQNLRTTLVEDFRVVQA
jgi:hypothetical protein